MVLTVVLNLVLNSILLMKVAPICNKPFHDLQ